MSNEDIIGEEEMSTQEENIISEIEVSKEKPSRKKVNEKEEKVKIMGKEIKASKLRRKVRHRPRILGSVLCNISIILIVIILILVLLS